MAIDLSQCRCKPFDHQVVGITELIKWNDPSVGRIVPGCFALFDEMGAGKTFQVIVAALILWLAGVIHRVIVVAPASVRDVWYDPELGELAKHLWLDVPCRIFEFHVRTRFWDHGPPGEQRLKWVITNYDYLRNDEHLNKLPRDGKTLFVIDESSAVKNYRAQQTKACMSLRKGCGRVWLLNGTPVANSPLDMFSQGNLMDPRVLECKYIGEFRARYAVMAPVVTSRGRSLMDPRGNVIQTVKSWRNLEDLQRRFAPYVLRRLKKDCLDLPEKLPSVMLTVPLTPKTWKAYKEMRDDLVVWLSETTVSTAAQVVVKLGRLSQITSGFLGGVEDAGVSDPEAYDDNVPEWLRDAVDAMRTLPARPEPRQVLGREKLNLFLERLDAWLEADPSFKLLVWSRHRFEVERALEELRKRDGLSVGVIWGGQKKADRSDAVRLLDPRTAPDGPVVVMATSAGSFGLNLTAAHTVLRLSSDYSLYKMLQGDDRVHRPGQAYPVSYFDIVATGPQGQRTIDHVVLKALADKQDLARWTTSAWVTALRTE